MRAYVWIAGLLMVGAAGSGCARRAEGAPLPVARAAESSTAKERPPKGSEKTIAPFSANVLALARENTNYRKVVFTGARSQLALMSIPAGGDIGFEEHAHVEQILVCVSGKGRASVAGSHSRFDPGDLLVITPGVRHNIVNVGRAPLELYTIYAPPNHIAGRVQATKADAEADHADEAFGEQVR